MSIGIEPHGTVFDKPAPRDDAFSREDFTYDRDLCQRARTAGLTPIQKGTSPPIGSGNGMVDAPRLG